MDLNLIIVTSVITAISTQLLVDFSGWVKRKGEITLIRKTIMYDLQFQLRKVLYLKTESEILLKKFTDKKDLYAHEVSNMNGFGSDIYNSFSKTDLFMIFKEKLVMVVMIYKTIDFLTLMSLENIYNKYLDGVKSLNPENRNEEFNKRHNFLITSQVDQLKLNLETINQLIAAIKKVVPNALKELKYDN